MKFHLMQTGVIGRKHELEEGMAGQRGDLYQRFLEEIEAYVKLGDDLGYYGYCQPEHHLQIEGFEVNNHPGMFSLFVGRMAKRMKATYLRLVSLPEFRRRRRKRLTSSAGTGGNVLAPAA